MNFVKLFQDFFSPYQIVRRSQLISIAATSEKYPLTV